MALELKDLNDDEQQALVALLEMVIGADNRVSAPEAKQLQTVVTALGKKAYETAADEVDRRFADEDALRQFLPSIERQEARELIYETVLEAALADVPVGTEGEILDWLAGIWHVKVRVVPAADNAK